MTRFISALLLVLVSLAASVQAGTLTFTTYYHNDHLGSPVAATDERNELLWRAHFRPYGERQENPAKGAFGTPGYTGHAQDKDSGLVYAGARYYDPMVGRFMAVDPVGVDPESPASFNRYAYANDNPMRFFDPDGRMSDDAILHGGWVPGFEGNLYNGPSSWGPISGTKRGLTPQGELVNGGSVKGASVATEAGKASNKTPDFVVSPGGTAFPVPKGATGPAAVVNPGGKTTGSAFTGGKGGENGKVDTMRIMDPTPPRGNSPGYPNGYIKYENKSGQGVDPYTGRTLSNKDSHFPID